jgi:hypothetical protein
MANRYFLNIGANWGDTANWSDTSGGTGGFSVPTNADDVFFDANSGNCTVNASNRVCKTLNFTGYTNTITMTFGITVSGSVTLVAAMTIAGASGLTINATGTFTSNGKTWPNALTFSGSITTTLADDLNVNGLLTMGTLGNQVQTFNGTFNINCNGGLTVVLTFNQQGTGTTTVNILGGTFSGGGHRLNTNINGNVTINTINFSTGILTYVSGNVTVVGTCTLSGTFNVAPIFWNNVMGSAGTISLQSDFNANGSISGFNLALANNGFIFNIRGLFVQNYLNGNGINVIGGDINVAVAIGVTLNINGNVTVTNYYQDGGTVTFLGGNITILAYNLGRAFNATAPISIYSGGNVKSTGNYRITNSATLTNFDKVSLKTITITAGIGVTMNKFFSGSALIPTRIQSTGANYTISFQDGFEKITKFTKISNCTVTNRGQLLCITDKSNKGGNVGVRYINQMPNGLPKNNPSTASPLGYAVGQVADPNTILI